MLYRPAFHTRIPRGTSTRLIASPSGMGASGSPEKVARNAVRTSSVVILDGGERYEVKKQMRE